MKIFSAAFKYLCIEREVARTHNTGLAKVAVHYSADKFEVMYRPEISLHLLITKSVNKNEKERTQN
jgi:hypothetical protein